MKAVAISAFCLVASVALADEYSDGWGPPIGARAPALNAVDRAGDPVTLAELAGANGLLLFFNRSTDW